MKIQVFLKFAQSMYQQTSYFTFKFEIYLEFRYIVVKKVNICNSNRA